MSSISRFPHAEVRRRGIHLRRLLIDAGESVDISVAASYLGREVLMSADAVSYSVTGGCGSITPEGVFTAAASGAEGAIAVECGGIKREISVSVSFEFDDMRGHWANENVKSLYAEGIVRRRQRDGVRPPRSP